MSDAMLLDKVELKLVRLGMLLKLLETSADQEVSATAEVIGVQVRELVETIAAARSDRPEEA